eukprot:CAMPEP_0171100900 /NCGR_PEP_ID=MMETSP0766_2-20121228/53454_1 /TAXON_ID=439317 /ORGANISM="Gambierdiscus australes, Strain CAWD 149" /LENGTH=146 /DNA_ID=CAMNT_0011560815 /DNA_START=38 /DNA_END=478 /DNA_ORIENTATION=+
MHVTFSQQSLATLPNSAAKNSDERMCKSCSANATKGMPIDHLLVARSRCVTLLVEERGLDRCAKDQTTHGHNANEGTASEEANRCSLWSVAQRAKRHKRPNDEVAMSHANLQPTLPWLQTLAVESQVAEELLCEGAVRHRGLHLVT